MPKKKKANRKADSSLPDKQRKNRTDTTASTDVDFFWSSFFDDDTSELPDDLYCQDVVGKTLWQTIALIKDDSIISETAIARIHQVVDSDKSDHIYQINQRNKSGLTPLGEAICAGNLQATMVLITLECVLEESVPDGLWLHAVLRHLAGKDDQLDFARSLIDQHPLINQPDSFGDTPLHIAINVQKSPLLALTLLLNGADPNKSYENGELLLRDAIDLHRAAESHQVQQRRKTTETVQHTDGTIGLLRELLEKLRPEHIEAYGADNRTALTYAAVVGSSNLVRLILEYHPNCDVLDDHQRNIMHHLAMVPDELYSTAHRDTVLLVDEAGVDFFAQDSDGNTPAMLACIQKNSHIARLILGDNKGQIHLKNHNHEHMLFLAIQSGNNALCELVLHIERSLTQAPYSLIQTDCPISPNCHALIKQHYSREIQKSKYISPILLCILLWKIQPQSSNLLLMLLRACFTTGYPAEDLYHHALYSGALDAIPILSRFGINIQERHLNHLERIGKPSQTPLNVYFSAIRQINSELSDVKEASVMTHLHQVPLDIFPVTWVKNRPDLFGEVYTLLCLETNNFLAKNSHFWSCVSLSRMSRFHQLDDQNSDFSLLFQRSVRAILLQCEQSKIIKRCPPEKREYFASLGISFDTPSPEQMHQLTQNANYESEMQRIIPARDLVFINTPSRSTLVNGKHNADQTQVHTEAYETALSFWQEVLEILYRETVGETAVKNTPILTLLVDIIDIHISRLLVENIRDSNGFFNALRVLNQCEDEAIRQATLDEFHKLFQHSGSNDGLGILQGLINKIRLHTTHKSAIVYTSAEEKIPLEGLFDISRAYHQHLQDIQSDKAPRFYADFLNHLLQPGQILSDPSYVKSWLAMDLSATAWIRHADNQLRILLYCARLTGLSQSTEQCTEIFKLLLTVLQPEIVKDCVIHPMVIRYLTEFDRLQMIRFHSTALYLMLHSYVQHHVIMSVRSYRSDRHTLTVLQTNENNCISQLQHEISELNTTIESSDRQGRELQQRIDGMSASHSGLKKEMKQLTTEKRQLSSEVETMRRQLDENNAILSRTRDTSTQQEEAHIHKIREYETVISDLEDRLTSYESRSDQQLALIKKHEQTVATHEQQHQRDIDTLLRKHRQINAVLQEEQQALAQSNQQLRDKHQQDQDRIMTLESTLDLERKAYQTASESTQTVISNTQQENDKLRSMIKDLEVYKRQADEERSLHESMLKQNHELQQQLKAHESAQENLLARIRGEEVVAVNDTLSARWIREVMAEIHRSFEPSSPANNGHSKGKKLSRRKQTMNGEYASMSGRNGFFYDTNTVSAPRHRIVNRASYLELFDGMHKILNVLSQSEMIRSIHLGGSIALCIARNTSPQMLSLLLYQMEEDIDLTLHVDDHTVNGQILFPAILKLLPGYTMHAKHSINKCLIVSTDTRFRFDLSIRKHNETSNHPDSISWLWSSSESGWIIDPDRLTTTQQQFLLGTWNDPSGAANNYSLFWAIHQQIKHYSFGFSSSATFALLIAAMEATPSRERVGSTILEILKKFVGTSHWPSAIALAINPFEYGSTQCSMVHYLLPPTACFPRNHQLSAYDTRHLMTVLDLLVFIKTYWMQFEIDTEQLNSVEGAIDWSQISLPVASLTTTSPTKI